MYHARASLENWERERDTQRCMGKLRDKPRRLPTSLIHLPSGKILNSICSMRPPAPLLLELPLDDDQLSACNAVERKRRRGLEETTTENAPTDTTRHIQTKTRRNNMVELWSCAMFRFGIGCHSCSSDDVINMIEKQSQSCVQVMSDVMFGTF